MKNEEKLNEKSFYKQYSKRDLKRYRHSRYFNLQWFRYSRQLQDKLLNFEAEVKDLLDKGKFNFYRTVNKNVISYHFVNTDKRHKVICRTFKMKNDVVIKVHKISHNILNVKKKDAWFNPYVWVVAENLNYIKFPRKWKQLCEISRSKTNAISLVENIETGERKIRIYDLYHRYVHVWPEEVEFVNRFLTDMKRLQNLKPFFQRKISKEALKRLCRRNGVS